MKSQGNNKLSIHHLLGTKNICTSQMRTKARHPLGTINHDISTEIHSDLSSSCGDSYFCDIAFPRVKQLTCLYDLKKRQNFEQKSLQIEQFGAKHSPIFQRYNIVITGVIMGYFILLPVRLQSKSEMGMLAPCVLLPTFLGNLRK